MNYFDSKNRTIKSIQYIERKKPSKIVSEDALVINEDVSIYGVMDGSTPIDDFKDKNGHNSAYLAANLIKNHLMSLTGEVYLINEVLKANKLLRNKMEKNKINFKNKHDLWSTCVSVIQIKNNKILYASLGDTMILTCDKNNKVNTLTVNSVKNISARARLKRECDRFRGIKIPPEKYYENEKNKISYHRELANTPNGYSIANGMEEAKYYIQSGMVDIKEIKDILIMSDGVFDAKKDLRNIFTDIKTEGLVNYVNKLTLYEKKNNLNSDDKSAILLSF